MNLDEARKPLSVAERFAALSRVGTALMSELDESRLLRLIAETARDLTQASFAAFTLRPIDELGQPIVPSEGSLFHLAAVVGVTKEQEALFRRMPLGGEGLLAPIFRHGVSVLVPDALDYISKESIEHSVEIQNRRDNAREAAFAFAHGQLLTENLRSMGVPRGHPVVRSFLGTPLLDRSKEVLGGLLLGHTDPGRFTQEDETLLIGLAAQAAVALENARLYRAVQMRAQELNAIFESIADGVTLVDANGKILRENGTARRLREQLQAGPDAEHAVGSLLHSPAKHALNGADEHGISVTINTNHKETREYIVKASPLRQLEPSTGPLPSIKTTNNKSHKSVTGAVVVWHDVLQAVCGELIGSPDNQWLNFSRRTAFESLVSMDDLWPLIN